MKFDVEPTIHPYIALRLVRANCDIGAFAKAINPVKDQYDVVSTLSKMHAEESYGIETIEKFVKELVANKDYIIQPAQTQ